MDNKKDQLSIESLIGQNDFFNYLENNPEIIMENKYLLLGLLGSIFYGIGYLFLYGYYFGGSVYYNLNKLFNLLINPVPFSFKAVIMVGIIVTGGISVIILVYKLWNESVIGTIFIALAIHITASLFFIGTGEDLWYYFFFGIVWLFPFSIIAVTKYIIISSKRIFIVFSSFCYVLISAILLGIFDKTKLWGIENIGIWMSVLSPIITMVLTISLNKYYENYKDYKDEDNLGLIEKGMYYLMLLPIISFVVLFLMSLLVQINEVNSILKKVECLNISWLVLLISLFITLIIFMMKGNKMIKKFKEIQKDNNSEIESVEGVFSKIISFLYSKSIYISIVVLFIMFIYVVPYGIFLSGKIVRIASADINDSKKAIRYSFDNKTKKISGEMIATQNGNSYISSDDFQLIILKSKQIEINESK